MRGTQSDNARKPPGKYFRYRATLGFCLAVTAFVAVAVGEEPKKMPLPTVEKIGQAQNVDKPRQHFKLKQAANLTDRQAEDIYSRLKLEMVRGYGASELPAAINYQKWQRYNSVPFRSAAHGRRFVNHYANAKAKAYGKFEKVGIMPVGAIIAKDNITVKEGGRIHPGALLLMEKMPIGFNYVSGDWRYTMVMPDGSLFGITNGVGSKKVEFCIACHLAAEKFDHLHFPPKEFRRP